MIWVYVYLFIGALLAAGLVSHGLRHPDQVPDPRPLTLHALGGMMFLLWPLMVGAALLFGGDDG